MFAAHGWAERQQDREMLFDLYFDPSEVNNLVDHPDYQDILQEMRDKLTQWQKDTEDPILDSSGVRFLGGRC